MKFKPCPFCGKKKIRVLNDADYAFCENHYSGVCISCGARGPDCVNKDALKASGVKKARAAWNRRVELDKEGIEKLGYNPPPANLEYPETVTLAPPKKDVTDAKKG